jgi:hydroxypyruvate reductase
LKVATQVSARHGREILLDCFQAALDAVDARRAVARQLAKERLEGDWQVLAIGKAAGSMTLGALEELGERLRRALVVTCPGHVPPALAGRGGLRVVESAHPRPDPRSIAAGEAVAEFVAALPARAQVLVLVSGGASSLVELPVPGIELEDLRQLNDWALGSGRPIEEINRLRRRVSRLKGGGLAALLGSRRVLSMMISDVPGDDPAVIGSGLLHRTRELGGEPRELPPRIRALLSRAGKSPQPPRREGMDVPCRIVATVGDACRAAGAAAAARGLRVRAGDGTFSGDAATLGRRFAAQVLASAPQTFWAWGGESTVRLPLDPGRGGRNQHLALSAALAIEGCEDVWLLAAGTDGVDGCTEDAGAVVDGGSCGRGRRAGLEPRDCLAHADSGSFLEASGDLLHTGPTLSNVGDLVLGLSPGGGT